jgi:hypothetical protein
MDTENVEVISQWVWLGVSIARIAAWPLVIALIAWWQRDTFRKFLESLPRRPVTVKGPGGWEATVGAAEQLQEARKPPIEAAIQTAAPAARPAVADLEGRLRAQLVGDQAQQTGVLLRELAETRVRAGHESIYRLIFGSQIQALKQLDLRGTATVQEARQYYDNLIPLHPDLYPNYPFESWLNFLVAMLLVQRDGDLLSTTIYGHDFLMYLTANRISEAKPF